MSPARKKAAKKRAKKKSAKRSPRRAKKVARKRVAKRAAKKVAKRRAKKSASKKRARKPATKKSAARKPARKPAKKKSAARKPARRPAKKKPARRPKLKIVPRPRPPRPAPAPPEPQAFAEAKANASAKDLILFELVRARVALAAAIQGMSAASAELPIEPGKWSSREMILHVAYWDREMLPALEAAFQHGTPIPLTHEDTQRQNPVGVAELQHHDWESARRLLQIQRERLMEEFQSIPEEPAAIWTKQHPVGKLARILTDHDRHHAEKIKTARLSRGE